MTTTPVEPASSRYRRTWLFAGPVWLALVLLMLAANPATTAFVHNTWLIDGYSHSWLVVVIAIWVVWRERARWLVLEPRPSLFGVLLLALIALGWWLGYAFEVRAVQQLALTAAFTGITWALFGFRVTWVLAFPLAYLFLTVSAWDVFNQPMQDATAAMSAPALRLIGVPVFRDGPYLTIPQGLFLVNETCAGLRYLLAALSIGSLYAYLAFAAFWRRALFVALAAVYSLLLNVVRVVMVVYAGHVTDMQHSWVRDHDNLGWILFGVGLLLLFLVGNVMQRFERHTAVAPVDQPTRSVSSRPGVTIATAVVCAAVLAFPAAGARWVDLRASTAGERSIPPELPHAPPAWSGPLVAAADWRPDFPAADRQKSASYDTTDGGVHYFYAWYAFERGSAKLSYFQNALYERRRWRVVADRAIELRIDGRTVPAREQVLRRQPSGEGVRVLRFWYELDGQVTNSVGRAKLLGLQGVLRGRPDAAIVAVAADGKDADAARMLLDTFVGQLGPSLHRSK